jgi:hypothetical protein
MQNYSQYIEEIKKKLDAMNKASGFNPDQQRQAEVEQRSQGMPSNDVFDMLGAGAKLYQERKKRGQI